MQAYFIQAHATKKDHFSHWQDPYSVSDIAFAYGMALYDYYRMRIPPATPDQVFRQLSAYPSIDFCDCHEHFTG
jgi:hypothetical protein